MRLGLWLQVVLCGAVIGCAASPGESPDRDLALPPPDFSFPSGFDFAGLDLTSTDLSGGCAGADLMNDSNNCGRCGRSCGTDVCAMGACPVKTLFPNEIGPVGLAMDATSLYWTAGIGASGYINKGLIGGGVSPTPLDSSLPYVQGIAAAGTKVIWAVGGATDGAGKLRVSTSGGTPADLVTGENFPRGVYTDGTNVYWTAMGTNANSYQDGAIRRSGTTAPGSAATVGNATALHYAGIVYLQGTNLFFTEQGSNATTSSIDGKVSKILATAVGSTAPTPIQTGQNDPFGIAADATNVYWLTATAANKQAQTSGTLMNVAMAQVNPSHIVVDGVGIYWADSGTPDGGGGYSNGSIMYAPLNGGAAIAIATGQKGPIKLIADATSVYWTNIGTGPNFTDGSICKTVK